MSHYNFPFSKEIYSQAIEVINGRTSRERKRKSSSQEIDKVNTVPFINTHFMRDLQFSQRR